VSERRELAPIVFKVLGGLLLAYLVVPLIYLIFRVGWQETVSSFANPRTIRAVEVSLLTSFISVSVMTFFGVPLGYLLARPGFKGRQLLISLVFVPMALPPLVGGVLLLLVYGPYGLVGALFEKHGLELVNSLAGIVLAQVFVAAPYVVIASISAFGRVDERLEKASAVLGANQWRTFRRVSLPLAWPGIMAGVMLAWVRTLGEFGATFGYGVPPQHRSRFFMGPADLRGFDGRSSLGSLLGGPRSRCRLRRLFLWTIYQHGFASESI
jgi:molybdate/tungstate transport system permease protein